MSLIQSSRVRGWWISGFEDCLLQRKLQNSQSYRAKLHLDKQNPITTATTTKKELQCA